MQKLALKPWVRPTPPSLVLRNAQVVDPAESKLLQGPHDVVIEDGLILSVSPAGVTPDTTSKDSPVLSVDLAGKFLCPYVGAS